jgi:hypothetical protein
MKEYIMRTTRRNTAMGLGGLAGAGCGAVLYGPGYGAVTGANFDEDVHRVCADGLATIKGIALFFAAPFVGLAYIVAFPFVGLGMAAWFGGKALMKYAAARKTVEFAKWVCMLAVAPLIGLALVILFPLAGAAMLAWVGGKAALA